MCYYLFKGSFFPKIPYLKTNVTSLLILFCVIKDFEEKEVEFLTELFQQKLQLCITNWLCHGLIEFRTS